MRSANQNEWLCNYDISQLRGWRREKKARAPGECYWRIDRRHRYRLITERLTRVSSAPIRKYREVSAETHPLHFSRLFRIGRRDNVRLLLVRAINEGRERKKKKEERPRSLIYVSFRTGTPARGSSTKRINFRWRRAPKVHARFATAT